jgi:hypothetical protein
MNKNSSKNYRRSLGIQSLDMINERWNEVLERLYQLSIEYSKELQAETGVRYDKNGKHDIWLFPPFRLLAMNLILSYWIGWISVPEKLSDVSDWRRIEAAYNNGKDAFFEQKKNQGWLRERYRKDRIDR